MASLKVGNREVPLAVAKEWVTTYTSAPKDPKSPFGYPWYDTYDTGESDLLVDGDLLAPALLNVRTSIAGYVSLKTSVPQLNEVLATISANDSLLDAAELSKLGLLFEPLDEDSSFGISGTTLAKVLHRKRPHFVPLYDREVRTCYLDEHDGTAPRIPRSGKRTWAQFMMTIAAEIRSDIVENRAAWDEVHQCVQGDAEIGLLRTFDIVAWNCGKASRPKRKQP